MITGERVVVVLLEVDLEDGDLDRGGELLAAGRGGTDDAAAIQRFLRLLDALQAQALQSSADQSWTPAYLLKETAVQRGRHC